MILEFLSQPWPWYVSGPLLGLMVPLLLLAGNKPFGVSSSLSHICAMCVPSGVPFFSYDWKKESWSLVYVLGIIAGGFLAGYIFRNPDPVELSGKTISDLQAMGISAFDGLMPSDIFNLQAITTLKGFIILLVGGFMVGFGTRYANGCTSGHTISGLSALSVSSLVATVCFFAGGLTMAWLILPHILRL